MVKNTDGLTENEKNSHTDTYFGNASKINKEDFSIQSSEHVENTPFTIIGTPTGHFITIGNNVVSEGMEKDQALQKINNKSWDLITAYLIILNKLNKTL